MSKAISEYLAQGFAPREISLIQRHDKLHEQFVINGYLKPRKKAEMFAIIARLGL